MPSSSILVTLPYCSEASTSSRWLSAEDACLKVGSTWLSLFPAGSTLVFPIHCFQRSQSCFAVAGLADTPTQFGISACTGLPCHSQLPTSLLRAGHVSYHSILFLFCGGPGMGLTVFPLVPFFSAPPAGRSGLFLGCFLRGLLTLS